MTALHDHPDQKSLLLADPTLAASAIEEVLRYQSPNQLGNRETTAPVTIGGLDIPAGTNLHLCIGAANRDPAQFPDPDRFDITRKPNRHLAFAGGPHVCVGLTLARLEGRIAVSRFLARFPDYRLTEGRGTARAPWCLGVRRQSRNVRPDRIGRTWCAAALPAC